ncbi:MAG: hypothetical protein ACK5P6_08665 [Pseudobdellovibrionaceae bacterium]
MQHELKQTSNFLSPVLLVMKSLTLVGLFLWLGGCVNQPVTSNATRVIRENSNQRIYYFNYDSVWRAAQLALKYPIAVNNMDNGILETDYIKALDGFTPPHLEKKPSDGVRYKITLTLAKGKVDNQESARVSITKTIEKKRDFFSEPESLESDGLEERAIFYRIERELVVEEALKKAQKKGQL